MKQFGIIVLAIAFCLTPAAFADEAPSFEKITLRTLDAADIDYVRIPGPATFAHVDTTAEAFGAVRQGSGLVADGKQLRGDTPILSGTFINTSDAPIDLLGADGGVIRLMPGDVAIMEEAVFGDGCSVSCGSGYFACCSEGSIMEDSCKCRENGSSDSGCDSGGTGATGCAVDISEALRFGGEPTFE